MKQFLKEGTLSYNDREINIYLSISGKKGVEKTRKLLSVSKEIGIKVSYVYIVLGTRLKTRDHFTIIRNRNDSTLDDHDSSFSLFTDDNYSKHFHLPLDSTLRVSRISLKCRRRT